MIDKRSYNSYMVKPGITVNIPKNDGKVTIENYGQQLLTKTVVFCIISILFLCTCIF